MFAREPVVVTLSLSLFLVFVERSGIRRRRRVVRSLERARTDEHTDDDHHVSAPRAFKFSRSPVRSFTWPRTQVSRITCLYKSQDTIQFMGKTAPSVNESDAANERRGEPGAAFFDKGAGAEPVNGTFRAGSRELHRSLAASVTARVCVCVCCRR